MTSWQYNESTILMHNWQFIENIVLCFSMNCLSAENNKGVHQPGHIRDYTRLGGPREMLFIEMCISFFIQRTVAALFGPNTCARMKRRFSYTFMTVLMLRHLKCVWRGLFLKWNQSVKGERHTTKSVSVCREKDRARWLFAPFTHAEKWKKNRNLWHAKL